jgi:hypothetical protein
MSASGALLIWDDNRAQPGAARPYLAKLTFIKSIAAPVDIQLFRKGNNIDAR